MLTLEQIKIYIPEISRTGLEKFAVVEYLQCEVLDSLFRQKMSEKLSFIGGTASRIVYGNTRFSEDLDFDNFGLSFDDFDKLISKTATHLQEKGLETEFRLIEKGAYHCYLKFPKILYDLNLSPMVDQKILVKIDMTEQRIVAKPEIFELNRFGISCKIITNSASVLLSQKMIAAIGRKTPKGRDFFDISFLYGLVKPDFDYIEAKQNLQKDEFMDKFRVSIDKLDFNALSRDVAPFLLRPDQIERVANFPEFFSKLTNY